jgi:hypothetical protein
VEEADEQSLLRALRKTPHHHSMKEHHDDDKHGGALPITGWTDSLDGIMDTKQLCEHIKTEIDVERERFKSNTKRHLEKKYGAARVMAMEKGLHVAKEHVMEQLRRGGCADASHDASVYQVWRTAGAEAKHCSALMQQLKQTVQAYQVRVKRMMLRADRHYFMRAVDKLYTVTRSLKARLEMQNCPNAPISAVAHAPPAAVAPMAAAAAVAPVAAAAPRSAKGGRAAPRRSGRRSQDDVYNEPSRLRQQIAAGSERIQKHQKSVEQMDTAIGAMRGRMGRLQRKMRALREQMRVARAKVRRVDDAIVQEVSASQAKALRLSHLEHQGQARRFYYRAKRIAERGVRLTAPHLGPPGHHVVLDHNAKIVTPQPRHSASKKASAKKKAYLIEARKPKPDPVAASPSTQLLQAELEDAEKLIMELTRKRSKEQQGVKAPSSRTQKA